MQTKEPRGERVAGEGSQGRDPGPQSSRPPAPKIAPNNPECVTKKYLLSVTCTKEKKKKKNPTTNQNLEWTETRRNEGQRGGAGRGGGNVV